jgi:CubicO group peptidase (beta-lactamase class C family)
MNQRLTKVSSRQMLTHSAGMVYYFMGIPAIEDYYKSLYPKGTKRPLGTVAERFDSPLRYEPGTSWQYSCSLDWVGLAVARIAKMDFEAYCQTHVFGPLGIKDYTFFLDRHPELEARMVTMSMRDPTPNVAESSRGLVSIPRGPLLDAAKATQEMGGQGLYGSVPSFLKILHSILADDEKLLSCKTTATMFEPQLSSASQTALQNLFGLREDDPRKAAFMSTFPQEAAYDWGFGGVLSTSDVQVGDLNWRRKGCLAWGGMPNLNWVSEKRRGSDCLFNLYAELIG